LVFSFLECVGGPGRMMRAIVNRMVAFTEKRKLNCTKYWFVALAIAHFRHFA
jgi:hypothetical protein